MNEPKNPLIAVYIRNRTLTYLLRKSLRILRKEGLGYWKSVYLKKKTHKIIHKINDVPLIDLRFGRHSIGMPIKSLSDCLRVIGVVTTLKIILRNKQSIEDLSYQAWILKKEVNGKQTHKQNNTAIRMKMPWIKIIIYGDVDNKQKYTRTIKSIEEQIYSNIDYISHNKLKALKPKSIILLIKSGDMLAPTATYEVARAFNDANSARVVYFDHDVKRAEIRTNPFFKPDWSPALFKNFNYLGRCIAIKTPLKAINFSRLIDEETFDTFLDNLITKTDNDQIVHITKVLVHLDTSPKLTKKAFQEKTKLDRNPKVSIIVPFRDKPQLLRSCVDSVLKKTSYSNFQLVLVDNQSKEPETLELLESLSRDPKVAILKYDKKFNYSAINNFAVGSIDTELVLFLNNDTSVISNSWLDFMVRSIQDDGVGAVGARLLYPNNTVQHAGVVIGICDAAGHVFRNLREKDPGYFAMAKTTRNVAAVTGACLLTYKNLFTELGGFDAVNLPVNYNDIDYCLKVISAGNQVVYNADAELYHYESASRDKYNSLDIDHNSDKMNSYRAELKFFQKKWANFIKNDPYYSPNLTRHDESCKISR